MFKKSPLMVLSSLIFGFYLVGNKLFPPWLNRLIFLPLVRLKKLVDSHIN